MKVVVAILCFIFSFSLKAQTFWTELFNNGCSANCLANGSNTGNGAWSVVALAGDANPSTDYPNQWYVSCAENGHTNGVCGTGCVASSSINTLASLHLGSTSAGDIGAAYDAGGLCGWFWCTNTHKRVQSPLISTIGRTSITLAFDYIEFGDGTNDDMYAVQTSTNGGTSWVTLTNPAKTTCCGGSCDGSLQGRWTAFTSVTLPVSAENIANFRIAFVWRNNDDGLGDDPSFAVDNITLSTPVSLPVELIDFSLKSQKNATLLNWETAIERNTDYFEILKSEDGFSFNTIGSVKASGNSTKRKKYSFSDTEISNSIVYYKLKIVDLDKSFEFSKLLAADFNNSLNDQSNCFLNANRELEISYDNMLVNGFETVSIYNLEGKTVGNYTLRDYFHDGKTLIPLQDLNQGIYIAHLKSESNIKSYKILIP